MSAKKKIALFGGAFDPPHNGHLLSIGALLDSNYVDEVWIVPSGERADKKYKSSKEERKKMIDLAFQPISQSSKVKISWIEWEMEPALNGSWELISALSKQQADADFYLSIGADLLDDLQKWRHAETLRKEAKFLVHHRGDGHLNIDNEYQIKLVKSAIWSNVSSTEVRERLQRNESLLGMVPSEIEKYIRQKSVY
jgi:nicotinate-nucleotide adenylyltransferase